MQKSNEDYFIFFDFQTNPIIAEFDAEVIDASF